MKKEFIYFIKHNKIITFMQFESIDKTINSLISNYASYMDVECDILLKKFMNSQMKKVLYESICLYQLFNPKGINGNAILVIFNEF